MKKKKKKKETEDKEDNKKDVKIPEFIDDVKDLDYIAGPDIIPEDKLN